MNYYKNSCLPKENTLINYPLVLKENTPISFALILSSLKKTIIIDSLFFINKHLKKIKTYKPMFFYLI